MSTSKTNLYTEQKPTFSEFLKQNTITLLAILVLFSSFIVFFQFGRSEIPRTEIIDGKSQKIGKFATPKKDKDGNTLPAADQICIVGKDGDCNDIIDQNWLSSYAQPTNVYWDENYHIASAERYLQGKFYMEPHPGLGKMFIALGEKIFNANWKLDTSKLIGENKDDAIPYIKSPEVKFKEDYSPQPGEVAKFSFVGVRFFPVLFAWLCALVLFYLLYLLTGNAWIAFVFSMGYTFDNAIVVHSRGAMLDGIQLFFILSALTYFVHLWNKNLFGLRYYIGLGIWIGLAVATKVNGLILAPLILILAAKQFLEYRKNKLLESQIDSKDKATTYKPKKTVTETKNSSIVGKNLSNGFSKDNQNNTNKTPEDHDNFKSFFGTFVEILPKLFVQVCVAFVVIGSIFATTYYVHFSVAKELVPKNEFAGYTSEATRQAIQEGKTGDLAYFIPQMQDHLNFMNKFQKGVPKWDPTKGKDEAGSLPWTWPVGNHAIRYFVSKSGDCKEPYPETCRFSYLYLIPNMVVWLLALLGIFLGWALILSKYLFGLKIKDSKTFFFVCLFTGLYTAYMIAMTQIDRVMYLYHYFLPLTFALINATLVFHYIFEDRLAKTRRNALIIIAVCIFVYFVIYAPFTYRLDISPNDFKFKDWNKYWGLMMDF